MVRNILLLLAALAAVTVRTAARESPSPQKSAQLTLEREVDNYLAGPVAQRMFAGAILIAKDGKPILRKAFGYADWQQKSPNTPETRFMIFSITKQFTAALILRLQDLKKLSVSDPVSRHVEHWPSEWAPVTVHHL